MPLAKLDLSPDRRKLRSFGLFALAGFGALATQAATESLVFAAGLGDARLGVTAALAGVGCICGGLAWFAPQANRPLYVALTVVTFPVGWIVSHVLLALVFYALITPLGLLVRAARRDELRLGASRGQREASFWSDAHPAHPKERYFRQF